MRTINRVLCLFMILFALVQYNDPDGMLWMVIYLIPAFWTGMAGFRIDMLCGAIPMALLGLCVIAAVFATYYYWPTMPGWWRQEVWWLEETAREGMGAMTVLFVLLVVSITGWSANNNT